MQAEKLIIIGSGLAAWTAAIYAARADLQPLVYEGALTEENRLRNTLPFGQLNYAQYVDDFPGFPEGILGPDLITRSKQQAVRFGTRVLTEDVVSVDLTPRLFSLVDSTWQQQHAHSLIVATGAHVLAWNLGFVNHGVSFTASDDCMLPRSRNRPAAVLGGGDIAATAALIVSKYSSRVFVIHREPKLHATPVYADQIRANPKIQTLPQREVRAVRGTDEKGVTDLVLIYLETGAEELLPVASVFPCFGRIPNTKFLAGQLELDDGNYIRLRNPPTTETSVAGIFAAGEVVDPIYRKAITAAGMGCKAALDAERWLASNGIH